MTAPKCPRCGAFLEPIEELAALARTIAIAVGPYPLDRDRPDLGRLTYDAPRLAEALECLAGTCQRRPSAADPEGVRICAHADENGKGAHLLQPGERCTRASPPSAKVLTFPTAPGFSAADQERERQIREQERADAEERARRRREAVAAAAARFGRKQDDAPCTTSGAETTDPYLELAGDTGEVGAFANCSVCGARLRLEAGPDGKPRFPVHKGGETV